MKYDFDSIINRKNTNCLKWDLFDTELPMWVADMDFKVAPEISDEIISSGFKLSNNLVPMEKIIDYFKIYVDFLVLINNSKYGNL